MHPRTLFQSAILNARRVAVWPGCAALLAAATLLPVSEGVAQALVITDCQGFTRAVKQVEAGAANSVTIEVAAGAAAVQARKTKVTLTNQATGQVMTSYVESGAVTFENIQSGVYALEVTGDDTIVGGIIISGPEAGLAAAGAAVVGAGVVGGGAIAGAGFGIAKVIDNVDGGNDDEASAAPTPQSTSTPIPPRRPTVGPTATPTDCPQCDPEAIPPPIRSPFPPDRLPAKVRPRTLPAESEAPTPVPAFRPLSPSN